MSIKLYNRLRKYEKYLYTALYADYIRTLTNRDVEELIECGEELGISYKNNHCPKCLFDFVKKLAAPYFEQKKKKGERV